MPKRSRCESGPLALSLIWGAIPFCQSLFAWPGKEHPAALLSICLSCFPHSPPLLDWLLQGFSMVSLADWLCFYWKPFFLLAWVKKLQQTIQKYGGKELERNVEAADTGQWTVRGIPSCPWPPVEAVGKGGGGGGGGYCQGKSVLSIVSISAYSWHANKSVQSHDHSWTSGKLLLKKEDRKNAWTQVHVRGK